MKFFSLSYGFALPGNGMIDGYGCDAYIEATGTPVAVAQGLENMIRKLDTLAEFSVAPRGRAGPLQ